MRNVIIIGSGCAGNTAAIYAARANLKPVVVSGHEAGGQLSLTTLVENFPGFPEGISGPDLVENMRKQAEKFGAEYVDGAVVDADLSNRPFRLNIEGDWVETRTLIVASGASARWLGLESEQALIGHGVSSCATCDGFFYRDKQIMVVGGGDSAMEEANFLTRFGREVTLVHRRDEFRASKIMLDRARHNPKIKFLLNTVVEEIHDVAGKIVTGVRLRDVKTGKVWDQKVDGFFLAIGHIPNTKVFKGQLETDAEGYIVSKGGARTSVPGVFHAGDVEDRTYRQAITAAGAGCRAAMEAERFLEAEGHGIMIERISPPGSPAPRGPYSPAVRAGDFIFVSGQVPVDPATQNVVSGDVRDETRQTLTNIMRILDGCGAVLSDVVKCQVFLADGKDFAAMNEVYAEFFGEAKPARTTVVAAFAIPGIKVEIDAVAYKPA
jgi:thioredoxin reductase (NADPH)